MSNSSSPTPEPTPAPTNDRTDVTEPSESQEIIYYEGSPKARGELSLMLGSFVFFAVCCAIIYFAWSSLPWWGSLILLVVGLIGVLFPYVWVKRHRYKLTNSRIDTQEGILNIRNGTIWLWKVDDVQLNRSIIDRILGVGTISVYSSDKTSPRLELRSLPNPQALFVELKKRVDVAKRQRGILRLDGDAGGAVPG